MDRAAHVVTANTQDTQDTGKHPKSGLKRDNTEQVCRVIPWPHEHVLRHTGKPPTYDSLTISEFAAGSMRILAQIPGVPALLVHMASHFSELFDDVMDNEWPSARFARKVVLQAIENGHVDYNMTLEIRQIRTMALTRANRRPQHSQPTQQPSQQRNTPVEPTV